MAKETLSPILHSDFDGTAVETAPGLRERALKYPLAGIPGYRDFIRGVEAGGVTIGNIVSRRPDDPLGQRRSATTKSVKDIGMHDVFNAPPRILLEGSILKWWQSEARKAQYVAGFALERVVGMVDDKPHRVGIELARVLAASRVNRHPVVLGVVSHDKTDEYMDRFRDEVTEDFAVRRSDLQPDGISVSAGSSGLDVVRLEPYAHDTGRDFAEALQRANNH